MQSIYQYLDIDSHSIRIVCKKEEKKVFNADLIFTRADFNEFAFETQSKYNSSQHENNAMIIK